MLRLQDHNRKPLPRPGQSQSKFGRKMESHLRVMMFLEDAGTAGPHSGHQRRQDAPGLPSSPPEYQAFSDMRNMAGKVAVLREKTWELYAKQTTLEKSFATTGDTISQLRSRVSDCHSVSVQLKRENSGIEREVGELRGGMRSLARRADDLNKRLDEIDQLLMVRRRSKRTDEFQWYRENNRPFSIACK